MPIGRRRPLLARGCRRRRRLRDGQAQSAGPGGTAEQAYEQGRQRRRPAAAHSRRRQPPADPTVEKINQLAQLHASGALTDEEFAAAKARALGI